MHAGDTFVITTPAGGGCGEKTGSRSQVLFAVQVAVAQDRSEPGLQHVGLHERLPNAGSAARRG